MAPHDILGVMVLLGDTSNGKLAPSGSGLATGMTIDNGVASGSTVKVDGVHITLVGPYNGSGLACTSKEE